MQLLARLKRLKNMVSKVLEEIKEAHCLLKQRMRQQRKAKEEAEKVKEKWASQIKTLRELQGSLQKRTSHAQIAEEPGSISIKRGFQKPATKLDAKSISCFIRNELSMSTGQLETPTVKKRKHTFHGEL